MFGGEGQWRIDSLFFELKQVKREMRKREKRKKQKINMCTRPPKQEIDPGSVLLSFPT